MLIRERPLGALLGPARSRVPSRRWKSNARKGERKGEMFELGDIGEEGRTMGLPLIAHEH